MALLLKALESWRPKTDPEIAHTRSDNDEIDILTHRQAGWRQSLRLWSRSGRVVARLRNDRGALTRRRRITRSPLVRLATSLVDDVTAISYEGAEEVSLRRVISSRVDHHSGGLFRYKVATYNQR